MSDLDAVKQMFAGLTDEQRLEVMADYCTYCGIYDGDSPIGCQCWNDE